MEKHSEINNEFYEEYGERWYTAYDDPIALLRAENKVKVPWVLDKVNELGTTGRRLLDVGCGAGFLTNELSMFGFEVHGLDASLESLKVAALHDHTHTVKYQEGDAYKLPYKDESFDIVTNMDFLEHVEKPLDVIKECSRVLNPGGLFFYHTFNRNFLSKMIVIKLVEKFVKNTPKNMHVIDLFITPEELEAYCLEAGLEPITMTGIRPVISSVSFRTLFTGVISEKMRFTLTKSTKLSYMGVARKV